ncbi:hypothetical protein C8Q78DRAFT_810551 [Trametes maxima]|nr:hypothetical protein C8Q78DRAFT_810551 [Trametes maxima]
MSDASYMRGPSEVGASTPRGYGRGVSAPEPLIGLAGLQEFGLPGQNARRISEGSVLPRMSEDPYADFMHLSGPAPPPPAAPLPSPPIPGPRRMASLDSFSDRGRMSPVPVIRAPSPPPVAHNSPSASRKTPTPPSRPFSVMSQSTEQDLLAIAEMLSPNADATRADGQASAQEVAPVAELEPVPDVFFDEVSVTTSTRDSVSSSMSSIYSSYQRPSPPSVRSSMYTDSDGASYVGDDLPDPSLLSPLQQHWPHGGFNLPPRGSLPLPPLDDNRSLSSATSYSSLRTPSLSRHSASPQQPHPGSNSKLLGIIEEARYAEDQEQLYRVPSEDAQTITLDTPSGPSFPPAHADPYLMRRPEPRRPQGQVMPLQRRLPELEKLRITTQLPDSPAPTPGSMHPIPPLPPMPPVPASPVLSSKSSSSGASSHKGSSRSGLGKLFGRGGDKDRESRKSGSSGSVHASNQSVASFELGDPKAEAKRLKKEAARARTERLAQDLAEKARKRQEAAQAAKADRTKQKKSKTWEEGGGMYDGISYF